ncbi:hypothetical protein [Streptomyces gilvus]|uniref:hypothetical protein n=1 Tax=Streptomyces gilvus TaxID=2920937 RepID=UPI001F0FCEDD|nr:hypothetical protein [Streptomyces sp. CME 23]MCH5672425.1 hypothetical protein [Streptomyces sp. CME 23]
MIRAWRTLRVLPPLLLLPALLLTGCGTEKASAGTGPGDGSSTAAADPAELAARAKALGIAPELVYVTEAPGYTLAPQSVGVSGDDGFSAAYWSERTGTQLELRVDRVTFTAGTCAQQPVGGSDASVGLTKCTRDGDDWYRTAGTWNGYAVPKQGYTILLSGSGVARETLRDAALAVHRPSAAELDALLPPAPAPGATSPAPVRRGDLPPNGDGAPNNDVPCEGC